MDLGIWASFQSSNIMISQVASSGKKVLKTKSIWREWRRFNQAYLKVWLRKKQKLSVLEKWFSSSGKIHLLNLGGKHLWMSPQPFQTFIWVKFEISKQKKTQYYLWGINQTFGNCFKRKTKGKQSIWLLCFRFAQLKCRALSPGFVPR